MSELSRFRCCLINRYVTSTLLVTSRLACDCPVIKCKDFGGSPNYLIDDLGCHVSGPLFYIYSVSYYSARPLLDIVCGFRIMEIDVKIILSHIVAVCFFYIAFWHNSFPTLIIVLV